MPIKDINVGYRTRDRQLNTVIQLVQDKVNEVIDFANSPTAVFARVSYIDVRNYTSFAAAVMEIGDAEKALLIPNEQAVSVDITVPSNISLRFLQGGSLNIADTKTVTINGYVEAGLYQIFKWTGTGKVTLSGEVYTQWWGSSSKAINAAIQAVSIGSVVKLPYTDSLTAQVLVDKKITLEGYGCSLIAGSGYGGTRLVKAASLNDTAILIQGNSARGATLRDFTLDAEVGNGGDGIVIATGGVNLESVSAFYQGNDGIRIGTDSTENCNTFFLSNINTSHNVRHGMCLHGNPAGSPDVNAGTIVSLFSQLNGGDGLKIGNARLNTIVSILAENNSGYGIHATSQAKNNSIFGGDQAEANTAGNILDEGEGNIWVGTQDVTAVFNGTNTSRLTYSSLTAPQVIARGINAKLRIDETDAPADKKLWTWIAGSGVLYLRLLNDAENAFEDAISIYRAAEVVDRMIFKTGGKCYFMGLPVYANNAAAKAGGLSAGALYRTNSDPDTVCIVH